MSDPTFAKPADATHEVIEMECAALVRWGKGDPSGFLEIYAPQLSILTLTLSDSRRIVA